MSLESMSNGAIPLYKVAIVYTLVTTVNYMSELYFLRTSYEILLSIGTVGFLSSLNMFFEPHIKLKDRQRLAEHHLRFG